MDTPQVTAWQWSITECSTCPIWSWLCVSLLLRIDSLIDHIPRRWNQLCSRDRTSQYLQSIDQSINQETTSNKKKTMMDGDESKSKAVYTKDILIHRLSTAPIDSTRGSLLGYLRGKQLGKRGFLYEVGRRRWLRHSNTRLYGMDRIHRKEWLSVSTMDSLV